MIIRLCSTRSQMAALAEVLLAACQENKLPGPEEDCFWLVVNDNPGVRLESNSSVLKYSEVSNVNS